ncbi:LysR family transcriptional regulator [Achromobacter aloeverae]|uniref:LysR family transcriptional regulator n=1 Tax=Achromobacter aloeverae TaxID=1750518 RepID=A0A4V1MRR3_9BURK|nr:LysR family transcriptional regulator [Achromobacter aloeverae]RXN85951.1 LysR family transcriptional regulator [Achromobacter aloeverae]
MDLVQLRYFTRVAQLKSFSKASAALHIAQPALTRQVLLLEEELGVQLLVRHSRGAEPTAAGLQLLEGAEAIFQLVHDVTAKVSALNATVEGTLRVGIPPSLGGVILGRVTANFQQRYPRATLALREGLGNELRAALLADEVDLAVLTVNDDPKLAGTHLCDEELWVLQPRRSPGLPTPRTYKLSELAAQPLIQTERPHHVREYIEGEASRLGLKLNIIVETNAVQAIKDLVRQGLGAHISPCSGISKDILQGNFDGGPIEGLLFSRYLVRRADRTPTLAMTQFQELLIAALRDSPVPGQGIRVPPPR